MANSYAGVVPSRPWQRLLAALLLIGSLGLAPQSRAQPPSDMWFFGDSLSDTGNVFALTTILSRVRPDLIPGPFPNSPYAVGHFSNGEVWVEPLATALGLSDSAKNAGGLSLGPAFDNLPLPGAGGHNFAVAGARTDVRGSFDLFHIFTGLRSQIDTYLAQTEGRADPDALYVVLAGGNDIRDAAVPGDRLARAARTQLAAEAYRDALRRLIEAGARHIVAGNVADIGQTPEARYLRNNAVEARKATRAFNRAVALLLDGLEQPGVTIVRLDFFRLGKDIVEDAQENAGRVFGITNVDTPCLDVSVVFPDVVIPGAGTVDCRVSLFTDDLHPTDAAHHLMAATAAACLKNANASALGRATPDTAPEKRLLHYCGRANRMAEAQ